MLREMARDFANEEIKPNAASWDRDSIFPREAISKANELGLLTLKIPEKYGGGGMGSFEEEIVQLPGIPYTIESTNTDRLTNFGYKSNKTGFSVGSGFEFYDDLYWNTGISSYVEKLDTESTASASMKKQEGSYFDTFFNHTFSYDKRNQRYKTSDGYISRFTQNIPLISESYTLTNSYNYKIYKEWLDENVFTIGLFGQTSNSLSGKDIKLSDRLYMPASKLRGFESGKVGPKDGADYIGGNYAASINIATSLSQILPNLQNTNFSIFFDAGNVWGIDYSSLLNDESKIRSSVGIAVDFFTPIGPLNFSLALPISKKNGDKTETFRFNLGTTF